MHVHPDHDTLPHEPRRNRAATLPFLLQLGLKAVLVGLLGILTLGLWPAFLSGVWVWGWPPHQSRPATFARYLRWAWTEEPPAPGIPPLSRAYLILAILQRGALLPLLGLAWYLDELLYGRALDGHRVRGPLFVLSAARSGSTQIAHYLEEDPRLVAPAVVQILCPYVWVWRLVGATVGRVVPQSVPRAIYERLITEEFRQRHEGDPLRTDTFEVVFYIQRLEILAPLFGPRVLRQEFAFARTEPQNDALWEGDFVDFVDRLGAKTLLFAGSGDTGHPRRLFLKGHFQRADDALASRYPDAHFLTVVRDPLRRLKSAANHLHGNAVDEVLGAVPWAWISACLPQSEVEYCRREQAWYTREEGPARTVVRFDDYVGDLEGCMGRIYAECFGDTELPAHVPTTHVSRERRNYLVDRSLAGLGVDEEALGAQLADYRGWCRA